MGIHLQEVLARSVVHRSRIPGIDFVINPYSGCAFGCLYCYADFTRRFHKGPEAWGQYVDVRINAPDRVYRELRRVPAGSRILLSSVTDPYQPAERRYRLTRRILEILLQRPDLKVSLLTRSPLVMRDTDLFRRFGTRLEVGLSIPTNREAVRRIFEPRSPALDRRFQALAHLHQAGIRTYAFLGPLLPCDPEDLGRRVAPFADEVLVDGLHYPWKVRALLERHGFEYILDPKWYHRAVAVLQRVLGERVQVVGAPSPLRRRRRPEPYT